MKTVVLSGYIRVPECDLVQVREALPIHIEATRAEEGCLSFTVREHSTEAGRFDVSEEFESPAAFELHQKRVQESDWGSITKNVSRHYSIEGMDE